MREDRDLDLKYEQRTSPYFTGKQTLVKGQKPKEFKFRSVGNNTTINVMNDVRDTLVRIEFKNTLMLTDDEETANYIRSHEHFQLDIFEHDYPQDVKDAIAESRREYSRDRSVYEPAAAADY